MKDPKPEDIKSLIINEVIYAKYVVDNGVLYLNMIKKAYPNQEQMSEDFLVQTLSIVEETVFAYVAHLNIK